MRVLRGYDRLALPVDQPYIAAMSGLFPVLIALAVLATFGILLTGMASMIRGGEFNRRYGNKLMQWRVIVQAVALGLVMLALLLGGR